MSTLVFIRDFYVDVLKKSGWYNKIHCSLLGRYANKTLTPIPQLRHVKVNSEFRQSGRAGYNDEDKMSATQ